MEMNIQWAGMANELRFWDNMIEKWGHSLMPGNSRCQRGSGRQLAANAKLFVGGSIHCAQVLALLCKILCLKGIVVGRKIEFRISHWHASTQTRFQVLVQIHQLWSFIRALFVLLFFFQGFARFWSDTSIRISDQWLNAIYFYLKWNITEIPCKLQKYCWGLSH